MCSLRSCVLLLAALSAGCATLQTQNAVREAAGRHVYEMPVEKVWPHVRAVLAEKGYHLKQNTTDFEVLTDWKESMQGSQVAGTWTRYLVQANRLDGAACVVRAVRWTKSANSTLERQGNDISWGVRVKGDTAGMDRNSEVVQGMTPDAPSIASLEAGGDEPTSLRQGARASEGNRDLTLEWEILQRADPRAAARLEGKPLPQQQLVQADSAAAPRLGEAGDQQIGASLPTAAANDPSFCGPEIPDLEPLVQPGATLLLGEFHGTQQSPGFVGRVACHAAIRGRPVAVGLQLPTGEQPSVDRYLASAGSKADRDELLYDGIWRSPFQDGRSSEAMFTLIETLRALRAAGLPIRIFYFGEQRVKGEERDRAMAASVLAQRQAIHDEVLVVLSANLHPRVVPLEGRNRYIPMGALLAEAHVKVTSLVMAWATGTMWSCAQTKGDIVDCGMVDAKGPDYGGRAFVRMWKGAAQDPGYHGLYYVGPVSASAPAIR